MLRICVSSMDSRRWNYPVNPGWDYALCESLSRARIHFGSIK